MFIDTDTISHVPSDYVVLDIETTGFSACNDSILEIAAIKFHDGKKIDSFCSFVAPECELNEYASRVNGISSEMLKDAPPMEQVLTDFHAFIGLYSLVAHNASFDIPFLQEKMSQLLGISLRQYIRIDNEEDLPRRDVLKSLIYELNLTDEEIGIYIRKMTNNIA